MGITKIDAAKMKELFLAGARNIEANKDYINELNVFPVPDGDTGTNMTMTIMSAAREVEALEEPDMKSLSKAISQGALRGARGNSGVILSQLFRGFTKALKGVDAIDSKVAAEAFARASETAYKAVMKPKEGTILTVARGMSERAADVLAGIDDLEEALKQIIEYGDYILSITPDMLPVLKQAGVVDSGGQGLMSIMHGMYDCMTGAQPAVQKPAAAQESEQISRFMYSVKYVMRPLRSFEFSDRDKFIKYMSAIGEKVECEKRYNIVCVSLYTDNPGLALQKAVKYGIVSNIEIENLKEPDLLAAEESAAQQEEEQAPPKKTGFIAVSVGDGIDEIFRELGVDRIVKGGQTNNPSTEDILDAIGKVNAETIFVLPNNKNIFLAAQQAAQLTEDKKVMVVPSASIPQGIAAVINYIDGESDEENFDHMKEEMMNVRSAEITYAVRDTTIDDKEIHKGDIMGIGDGSLVAVGKDIEETAAETVKQLMFDDAEVISIYYGADVEEEKAQALTDKVTELYPDCEVELNSGGQPTYYYIISVE
ncbi:MAG: DAK2 domain-containing protein [Lachnospiraceae bacterium]